MKAPHELPAGIVPGISLEAYHATDAVSKSRLDDLRRSPAHCYALHIAANRPPREPRPWMLTGPLAHCAILEPDVIGARYAVVPEGAPKRPTEAQWAAKKSNESSEAAKAWWTDFAHTVGTRQIITAEQFATAQGQVEAVKRVPELASLLATGIAEASVFWRDDATDLECRARPDFLHQTGRNRVIAVDVKTIADLTAETVERSIGARAYHRQDAFYTRGLRARGLTVDRFVFAFVSASYPFLAASFELDDESRAQGNDEINELLELYAMCQREGRWPAFEGVQMTGLPRWARRSSEVEVVFA